MRQEATTSGGSKRSPALVTTFVVAQVVVPALALVHRLMYAEVCFVPFGWQMFSCLPD